MRLTNPNVDDWRRFRAYCRIREMLFGFGALFCGMMLMAADSDNVNLMITFGVFVLIAFIFTLVLDFTQRELIQQIDRYLND